MNTEQTSKNIFTHSNFLQRWKRGPEFSDSRIRLIFPGIFIVVTYVSWPLPQWHIEYMSGR